MKLSDDEALLDNVILVIFREELVVFKGYKQQQCCYPEIKIGRFLLQTLLLLDFMKNLSTEVAGHLGLPNSNNLQIMPIPFMSISSDTSTVPGAG